MSSLGSKGRQTSSLLTRRAVAERLGTSTTTVDRLRKKGVITDYRIGGRLVRFAEEDIAALIESARID
jgi:excisionase family DNA binding protein